MYPSAPGYLGKDVLTGTGNWLYWVLKKSEFPALFAENSQILFKFYVDPEICENYHCTMFMSIQEGKISEDNVKEI